MNSETVTWAKVRHLTDWATQEPLDHDSFMSFFVFYDLNSFEDYWSRSLRGIIPLLELVWCFSHDKIEVMDCWGKYHKGKNAIFITQCQVYTLSTWLITALLDLDHLVEVVSVRLLHYRCTRHSFHTLLFGRKSLWAAHTWSGSSVPPLWGRSMYINYLEFFCMGNLSFLPHLCIQPFVYIGIDSWTFILYFKL